MVCDILWWGWVSLGDVSGAAKTQHTCGVEVYGVVFCSLLAPAVCYSKRGPNIKEYWELKAEQADQLSKLRRLSKLSKTKQAEQAVRATQAEQAKQAK